MSALEQGLGGPAIEVVAKATRRRFTVEYKRKSVAFLLADLGITKTHSRPHVSNDNPFSEALGRLTPHDVRPKPRAIEEASSTPILGGPAILDPPSASRYARSTLGAAIP